MNSSKKTLFISDLHLEEEYKQGSALFERFLQAIDKTKVDALYILGDFFEAWIGDDHYTHFNANIISKLKELSAKVPVYLQHGNRDFLLGKRFMDAANCRLLPDGTIISLYGKNALLMHGDLLCREDINYLKWRKIAHLKAVQWLYLCLPLSFRLRIKKRLRYLSKQHMRKAKPEITDVTMNEVESVMQKNDVSLLIHGHTHRPKIHDIKLDGKAAKRIVLGAWHHRGNVLVYDQSGKVELIDFDENNDFAFLR